jgi:chromosome segregation ATPase
MIKKTHGKLEKFFQVIDEALDDFGVIEDEISELRSQVECLEIQDIEDRVNDLETEYAELIDRVDSVENDIIDASETAEEALETANDVQSEVHDLNGDINSLEREVEGINETLVDIQLTS